MPQVEHHQLENASQKEMKQAWKSCAQIAKLSAGNFYYAFMFLPEHKRQGIEALYAFCRAGDDLADDIIDGDSKDDANLRELLFVRLRDKLDLCYQGKYSNDQMLALCDAIDKFRFDRIHFDELLTGLESDLIIKRYTTFDELRLYCYRVASTVGLLCLKIFECDTVASRSYAEYLGIGMQITNILRDIHEDLDRDRIYIPQEDLKRFDLTDENLFDSENADKLKELVHFEAERALDYFAKADAELTPEMHSPLIVARIMQAIYLTILDRIMLLDKFDERVELSKWDKLKIARQVYKGK